MLSTLSQEIARCNEKRKRIRTSSKTKVAPKQPRKKSPTPNLPANSIMNTSQPPIASEISPKTTDMVILLINHKRVVINTSMNNTFLLELKCRNKAA